MRITGGSLRGRRIKAPPGQTTRPTSDRVREAIFNILGPPPPRCRVLDAFAGAGTLGLEAYSRGVVEVCFIDRSRTALRCVRDNLTTLEADDGCTALRGDAVELLIRWSRRARSDPPGPFTWVFIDPPYRSDLARRILTALGGGRLLTTDAVIIVEHDRRNPPDPDYGCLARTDRRRYGDTEVSFYQCSHHPLLTDDTAMSANDSTPPDAATDPAARSDSATGPAGESRPARVAIYPGTFDPVTNGHLDILERSLRIFDRVTVAIATNPRKAPLFTVQERIAFIASASGDRDGKLAFDSFNGLLVQYCESKGASCIVRGLRALADFEYEFQFAHMNRRLAPKVDTVFFMTDERNHYVSSSLVKEVASFGGDVSGLVPPDVAAALVERLGPTAPT